MGFLDSLFGKKPTEKDIMAFNYYLFFDYIPKRLHDWANNKGSLQSALTFDSAYVPFPDARHHQCTRSAL